MIRHWIEAMNLLVFSLLSVGDCLMIASIHNQVTIGYIVKFSIFVRI
jgi:hypothetical protein